jgi:hypothetical protein
MSRGGATRGPRLPREYARARPRGRFLGFLLRIAAIGACALAVPLSSPPSNVAARPAPADLALSRVPWEGGPAYYSRFPAAVAGRWDDPSFFPIALFYGKPEHAAHLRSLGINTYLGAEHDGSKISSITSSGMSVIAQQDEWTPAEVGNDPRVVGWFISDECDMGLGCHGATATANLAEQEQMVSAVRRRRDGRFTQANYGNGVLGTFWARGTMARLVQSVDVASVDKYAYTSPQVQSIIPGSPAWVGGAKVASSAAYGWLADRLRSYLDPRSLHPSWVVVETGRPYLTEAGAKVIGPAQIQGAVWSAIVHEARGIVYFQHSNNPACSSTYSLVDCDEPHQDAVKAVDAQISALAPVLNSQSYVWNFTAGVDTMLKTDDGHAYVFASVGLKGSTGQKVFTLPPGVEGKTVTVVGESRTLPVVGRTFSDSFTSEWSHHIYRISLHRPA